MPADLTSGNAVFARRAGYKSLAWFVVDRVLDVSADGWVAAMAHRAYSAQPPTRLTFAEVRKVCRDPLWGESRPFRDAEPWQ